MSYPTAWPSTQASQPKFMSPPPIIEPEQRVELKTHKLDTFGGPLNSGN